MAGPGANMWTGSLERSPRKMPAPFSRQTWRQMPRTRRRTRPVRIWNRYAVDLAR